MYPALEIIMSTEFTKRIYETVRRIPAGSVASYGQVALMAGNPRGSRGVGFALHRNPEPWLGSGGGGIPCHRVVFKDGSLSAGFVFGGEGVQRRLLEAEGVVFTADGRVDMALCRWDGRVYERRSSMLGIIAALNIEIDALKQLAEDKKVREIGGTEYVSGKIDGREVVLAVCGVGKVNAAACAQTMILEYMPDAVLNTGVAGGLDPALEIGDIAVASATVQHDFDTSSVGDPLGGIALAGKMYVEMPCAEWLVRAVEESAAAEDVHTVTGTIASGDQFICTDEARNRIVQNFGAVACEMEGGAIAQVCLLNKVDCCVIRAISDSANNDSVVDFASFAAAAAEKSIAVTRRVLQHM